MAILLEAVSSKDILQSVNISPVTLQSKNCVQPCQSQPVKCIQI